jgi:hypothetical protein
MDHSEIPDELGNGGAPTAVPAAWREPVVIGSEDTGADPPGFVDERFVPAADIGAEPAEDEHAMRTTHHIGSATMHLATGNGKGDAASAEEATAGRPDSDPDTPATLDDGGDDVPPEVPAASAETGPNRGEALAAVTRAAAVSGETIHARIRETVINEAESLGLGDFLENIDLPLDDAVEEVAYQTPILGTDETLYDRIVGDVIAEASETHSEALAAAGVKFDQYDGDQFELEITDPDTYTDAVGQLPPPATPEEQTTFNTQASQTVDEAIHRVNHIIIRNDPVGALNACHGRQPNTLALSPAALHTPTPDEQAFATSMLRNAGTLAAHLEGLGAPAPVVEPLRHLALAHDEGHVADWAVGVELGLIGNSDMTLGVERLTRFSGWEQVYDYLSHLQQAAPNAEFTASVRETVLRDIRQAIDGPSPNESSLVIRMIYGRAESMLRVALANIEQIMPHDI